MAGFTYDRGGIIRGVRDEKRLALVFTGGAYGEGATTILDALSERNARASFFVTGAFLRNSGHQEYLERMVNDGHYLGPHSDAHLLYCPWEDRDRTLVTEQEFRADLERNLDDLSRYDLSRRQMRIFIPPYEWYNEQIVEWSRRMGLVLINFTPGTRSHTDWAPNGHRSFTPSHKIFEGILDFEQRDPDGLRGFILLMHLGAGPGRTDKMHVYVGPLIDELHKRGYELVRIDELLAAALDR